MQRKVVAGSVLEQAANVGNRTCRPSTRCHSMAPSLTACSRTSSDNLPLPPVSPSSHYQVKTRLRRERSLQAFDPQSRVFRASAPLLLDQLSNLFFLQPPAYVSQPPQAKSSSNNINGIDSATSSSSSLAAAAASAASPSADAAAVVDPSHSLPLGTWSPEQLNASRAAHPFPLAWVPGRHRAAVPNITRGRGVYLYDDTGRRYLDWTSQAVCANLGHGGGGENDDENVDSESSVSAAYTTAVLDAVSHQLRTVPYVYGGLGVPEVRVRLNQLLAELLPGTLRVAVFPSSGAEAIAAGILMAQRYTGRPKIISFYRSYHGATGPAAAATGDCRRWYGGAGADTYGGGSHFVKAFSPFPLFFRHHGATDEEQVQSALFMLEEQILNEGPALVASIVMESIGGAGGCLVPPPGYLPGVRALCDAYGILLHLDEVMVGFGRTGRLFGFEHYEGVAPDIVSAAKGLSGATVPLSLTACTAEIMDFFEDQPLGWGSTYQAHPVALAAAYATVKFILEHNIVGRVQALAPLFDAEMRRLAAAHPCVKQYRAIGLLGCLDVHDTSGHNPKLQHERAHDAFLQYQQAYAANGLMGLHRYPHIHCAPPLVISRDELLDGFDRLHRSLTVLDEALGFDAGS